MQPRYRYFLYIYRRSEPASKAELTREGAEVRYASPNALPRLARGPAGGAAGGREIEPFRFIFHQNWSQMCYQNWSCSASKTDLKLPKTRFILFSYLSFPCRKTLDKWNRAVTSTDTTTYSLLNALKTMKMTKKRIIIAA